MSLPIVVPDASAILKYVLPSASEPESDRARARRCVHHRRCPICRAQQDVERRH